MHTLLPAYGRDYKSKVKLELDFNADLDFVMATDDRYINKSQLLEMNMSEIRVRYTRMTKVAVIKVAGPIVPIVEDASGFKKFKGITIRQYEKLSSGLSSIGYCLHCSRKVSNVEPDIEDSKCIRCDENQVQGLETILMMGYVN